MFKIYKAFRLPNLFVRIGTTGFPNNYMTVMVVNTGAISV